MKRLYLLLIFLCSLAFSKEMLLKIHASKEAIPELLKKGFYIYEVGKDYLIGSIEEEKISSLKAYPYDILIEDMLKYHQLLAPGDNFGRFHSYQEIVDTFNIIAQNNPNLVKLDTIGYSVQNRVILAMKISQNAHQDEHRPRIVWDGTTHGNENIGAEVCLYLVRYLLANYGIDPLITHLVNTREIWVIPIVNPDGMVARTRVNANGVDLNRDYGFCWYQDTPAPFSQPEIIAMRNFFQRAPFVLYITYHSGTRAAMWPWSWTTAATYDSLFHSFLTQRYASYTGYPAFQISRGLYEARGTSSDFGYGAEGALGLAIELCSPHVPDTTQIDTICRANLTANIEMLKRIAWGVRGRVFDSITNEPIKAIVELQPPYSPIYTDSCGYFFRYAHAGTYSLRVYANGYKEKIINNVVVPQDSYIYVEIPLMRDTTQPIFAYKNVVAIINDEPNYLNLTLPSFVLGKRDNKRLSLGVKGWAIYDMQFPIINGPGSDFMVIEDTLDPEGCSVYVSNNWNGPWYFCGVDTGTSYFDLSRAGLSYCRYIKIIDQGYGVNGPTGGYDLDAVEAITANLPALTIDNLIIDDSLGNNNRKADPGESCFIIVNLKNIGRISADSVIGILRTSDQYVTILDSFGYFGTILPDSIRNNRNDRFLIYASTSTPRGHITNFKLILLGTNYLDSLRFNLEIGEITITDPIPDNYQPEPLYYAYDDIDTFYQQAEPFEWVELRNVGVQLPITTDDQTIRIPLPFPIYYYGVRYADSLSICSNGWVSPIRTTSTVYTNQPLPDPTSTNPHAMICPNWDDLYPPYGNRIWFLYDSLNHRMIIEWDSVHYFSPNTQWDKFEIIIYDTTVSTPTGDNIIKFQYLTANNYVSNTVGIEDQTSTVGICAVYNNSYHRASAPLQPRRAIKIITGQPLPRVALFEFTKNQGKISQFANLRELPTILKGKSIVLPMETEKLVIYDITGKKVKNAVINKNKIENLPSGIYIIKNRQTKKELKIIIIK
jgi:hypothetical protein